MSSTTTPPIEALLERCANGDRKAQFLLYKQYARAMYNTCYRMLRNEADAEDVLQDAFVSAFKNLGTYRKEASFGSWLKRIVVNHCINHIKKKRLKTNSLDNMLYEPATTANEAADLKSDSPYNLKQIREAILKLADGYRMVFCLYSVEGYDHEEIGQILGISSSASKSQFSRAKKRLRELLLDSNLSKN